MTLFRTSAALLLAAVLPACQSVAISPSALLPEPSAAHYRCGDGSVLSVSRAAGGLTATDTRGFSATMPASPPGQSARYAEGIHALILEGRAATWFVSGQTPLECNR
ncbi:hypothetical protein [Oricola sp.]|uniref:hypothetical protein n=1 Tax=Oricola sp. TaxID=1979950 RepID=UPI003BAA490C